MSDHRLTELETRLTYAEHTVAELSDLVYTQSQTIDRVVAECRRLEQRVATLAEQDEGSPPPGDEAPPYY